MFRYCLNTSTIKGQKLSLPEEIAVAADVGYDGIEPWVAEIDAYVAGGGSLSDLHNQIADRGLTVENLIGFFDWAVDDATQRRAGFAEARRCFRMAAELKCPMVAAPPSGLTNVEGADLRAVAERYAALIDIGREHGVTPMVEFWGMSKTLGRLSEAVFVALEADRPEACVLADIFHTYKSGASFNAYRLLGPASLGMLHVNDYPAEPTRDKITDADRIYPGDGVAPLADIVEILSACGFRGALSIELFNQSYWRQDAAAVARTGLEKMMAVFGGHRGA